MTADMLMKALAGLLLATLVGIPVVVWLLVVVAAVRRAVTRLHQGFADARENRRRHAESRIAVATAAAVLADVPDPIASNPIAPDHVAPEHVVAPAVVGRWTHATPLDDESPEVIAAIVAGARAE